MKTVDITYRYGNVNALARPRPPNADAAQLRLNEGNRVFARLLDGLATDSGTTHRIIDVDPGDLGLVPGEHGTPKQRPFAAVLGCSDARVPIELIFNEGPNDLFVVRVAGNGLGNDVLGSLRYAIDHLRGSLRLVVVLGHSGCGAMSAAVDSFLEPAGYLPLATNHALRSILDRHLIVVQATARKLMSVFGVEVTRNRQYREALIEASIVTNAALAAYTVQLELHGAVPHDLRTVYGVYVLQSHEVWAPAGNAGVTTGLVAPPKDPASFAELGEAIVRSERIMSLMTSP
jgi:carbonic anhydrase